MKKALNFIIKPENKIITIIYDLILNKIDSNQKVN